MVGTATDTQWLKQQQVRSRGYGDSWEEVGVDGAAVEDAGAYADAEESVGVTTTENEPK